MLSFRGVRKAYGDLVAVRDLTLRVAEGETYGLLGPNGAGKTTAISMVAGVLRPDAGEIVVVGETVSVRHAGSKRHIGYVPQEIAVYPDLPAGRTCGSSPGSVACRGPRRGPVRRMSWP